MWIEKAGLQEGSNLQRGGLISFIFATRLAPVYSLPTMCQAQSQTLSGLILPVSPVQLPCRWSGHHPCVTDEDLETGSRLPPGRPAEWWGTGIWMRGPTSARRGSPWQMQTRTARPDLGEGLLTPARITAMSPS